MQGNRSQQDDELQLIKWLKELLLGKDLSSISGSKWVRVKGVRFLIKKIDVSNHLEGLAVLMKQSSTYDDKREQDKAIKAAPDLSKMKGVYRDIFLAGVVEPKLCRNEGDRGQWVDALFCDWDFCTELYVQIMKFTQGKKKVFNRSTLSRVS